MDDAAHNAAERRWPAWVAFLTAPWLPKTTAERTNHLSLKSAFLVHLLSLLLAAPAGILVSCWYNGVWGGAEALLSCGETRLRLAIVIVQHRPRFAGVPVAAMAGLELGAIGLAALVALWDPRPDGYVARWRHALRRIWLCTPQILTSLWLGVGVLLGAAASGVDAYWMVAARNLFPFICVLWGLWCAAILLAFLVAGRAAEGPKGQDEPPLCENCGYNLTGADASGVCPECGEGVADSIGPGARPGAPWERRRRIGWVRAWWESFLGPLRDPAGFARQLNRGSSSVDHCSFLAAQIVVGSLLVTACSNVWHCIARGNPFAHEDALPWLLFGPFIMCVSLALTGLPGLVGLTFIAASCELHDRRNVMRHMYRFASYATAPAVLGAAGLTMSWTCVATFEYVIEGLLVGLGSSVILAAAICAPNVLWPLWYLRLLFRGAAGVRYANR